MSQGFLDTPIEYLKGVGPKRAEFLKKEINVHTFHDLITFYPFRYVDRTKFYKINEIDSDQAYVQVRGKITNLQLAGKARGQRLTADLVDETGKIELIWFNGIKWIREGIRQGEEYIVFGKPAWFRDRVNMPHPELELAASHVTVLGDTFQPVYNSTEKLKSKGLDSRGMGKIMKNLVAQLHGTVSETLTDEIMESLKFIPREEALKNIHFPQDQSWLLKAQTRLKFEELFFIQLRLLKLRLIRINKSGGYRFHKVGDFFNRFYHERLPFELTGAQKKVMKEIRADLGSGKQMNRLLQGDVGSGKTLVALMCMLIALDNGFQACLMAPTEILSVQHFNTISGMLDGLSVSYALLTGSTRPSARKEIHNGLQNGEIQILVGTHALIEETVRFANLGLVIIDEQHRFGVAQRARLWKKSNISPHVLVMTATPIPRTLAMTLYGDLDVSVIDEMPPGRKPVKTIHFFESGRYKVVNFLRQQIRQGRQAYIVYPLIYESEALEMKYLMEGYEHILRDFPLPEYQISVVHGQMKPKEKDGEMQRFVTGKTHIMVATTVIEVGVDVPNASVMVIENTEHFGLAQLHQLRGRVGRGADQSYCILMSGDKLTAEARKRIGIMVSTSNGFDIAEEDLRLRGPGDLQGTQQSGILDLKLADLSRDEKVLKYARDLAQRILQGDPDLQSPGNQPLLRQLQYLGRNRSEWGLIS